MCRWRRATSLARSRYRDARAIRERLAKSDPGNARWQYDLGISNEKIGSVLMAQGDLVGALKSYQVKRDIISRLVKSDPRQFRLAARSSVSYEQDRRCSGRPGRPGQRADVLRDSLAIIERLLNPIRATPAGSATFRFISEGRRRPGCARQSGRRAEVLPRQPRHQERLAKSDPGNAVWQRDLIVTCCETRHPLWSIQ